MVAQFVLGVGFAAVVALGLFDDRKDAPAADSLQEGIRLLEEDDRIGKPTHDIDIARAVLRREGGNVAPVAK
jgi:hypothetical protein